MGEGSDQQQQSTTTEETSATLRSLKSLNQLSQNLQNLINRSGLNPHILSANFIFLSANKYFFSVLTNLGQNYTIEFHNFERLLNVYVQIQIQ